MFRLSRTFGQYSLMQCQPQSGRTHQIRVHALHTGHPILGDDRYGDAAANATAKKFGLKRLFLHAQSIAFPDDSGNELHFTAPLPEDLDRFLQRIRGGSKKMQDRESRSGQDAGARKRQKQNRVHRGKR